MHLYILASMVYTVDIIWQNDLFQSKTAADFLPED